MQLKTLEKQFKSTVMDFVDELYEFMPNDMGLLGARFMLSTKITDSELVAQCLKHLYVHRSVLLSRDEVRVKALLASDENRSIVDYLLGVLNSDVLDAQDRQVIWDWVEEFVRLLDEYVRLCAKNE